VGNGYDLSTTSVGIQLTTDIKAMIFRDTSRITELEEELRRTAADNAAMRARLEGDLNDLIGKLKRAEDDIERLKQRRVSFARICLSTY
jgi:septal ring factor EnvC (AmiA/AmiB activator)